MAKGWRSIGRASGAQVGKIAIRVHVCRGCGAQHKGKKPAQCLACHRMDFTTFDSQGEATYFAGLEMQERAGLIKNLQRQVRFPLMAHRQDGLGAVVGHYIADAVFERDGQIVISDYKGAMTDVAALKLRWMASMGLPVEVVTEKRTYRK